MSDVKAVKSAYASFTPELIGCWEFFSRVTQALSGVSSCRDLVVQTFFFFFSFFFLFFFCGAEMKSQGTGLARYTEAAQGKPRPW